MNRTYLTKLEQFILFIMIFVILQEWLKPIMKLTGTGHFWLFSLFIAICLVLSLVQLPIWVSAPIKLLYIGWFIAYVHNDYQLPVGQFFIEELSSNFDALKFTDWSFITDGFRTLLFFLLIWMLVYLVNYWITVRLSIFYFFVMTVFFIATLDTFSNYDGKAAIIKVVIIGLIMTALLYLKRFILKRNILIDWNEITRLMLPVITAVLLLGFIGYILPKAAPQWPDPVSFIKNSGIGEGEGEGDGVQKVGYGDNDTRLGGAFVADNTVVFEVSSFGRQYWRVETKDVYTSKGWLSSSKPRDEITVPNGQPIPYTVVAGELELQEVATVNNLGAYPFLLQPYGTIAYDIDEELLFKQYSEYTQLATAQAKVENAIYDVQYSEPIYNYSDLTLEPVITEDLEMYLNLPNSLPERVKELATTVTSGKVSAYDKARAIEQYFGRNGYSYSTNDVAVPEEEQDYVDQFLFETKIGYCDNFSTSMVVMLRSVGVPARWVKGFTTGEALRTDNDGRAVYEITNNEAHSWVEAYIEGAGWMPFEPTIGFANPANISYDLPEDEELLTPEEQEPEEQEETPPEELTIEEPEQKEEEKEKTAFSFAWLKIALFILLGVSIVGVIALWFTRKKWLPKYYINQYRRQEKTESSYVTAYARLLRQLNNYGLKRKDNQTLSSYAIEVDRFFDTDDMTKLTDVYERLIYSKDVDPKQFDELKESWEYLINRSSG
jgi:signal transduction histidine kinase